MTAAQEQQTDTALLCGVRDGDERSLEVLVRRHTRALHHLAAQVLDDHALADDVVQETWLAVLRAAGSFEGRSSVRSWLLAVCANTARTRRARERRSPPVSAVWREEGGPAVEVGRCTGSGAWTAPVTAWDDLPYDAAARQALRHQLDQALAGLTPRQREAVVVSDVLGCPGPEAARLLGVSAGHLRTLLSQARARLRASLTAQLAQER